MTIYVPEQGAQVSTFIGLVNVINQELADYVQEGTTQGEADGHEKRFMLNDENIVPGSLHAYFDEVEVPYNDDDYPWTVNNDAGWVTFGVAPPSTVAVPLFRYQYKYWSDAFIKTKINQTIRGLFRGPDGMWGFYRYIVDPGTFVADPSVYEYIIPGAEYITMVEIWDGVRFRKMSQWETIQGGMDTSGDPILIIKFFNAPFAGQMRVSYVAKPGTLVSDLDDIVTHCGLPERASECIVYGAIAKLAAQPMIKRVRADIAVNTQLQGVVFPRDLALLIQVYDLKYRTSLDENRMPPFVMRLTSG